MTNDQTAFVAEAVHAHMLMALGALSDAADTLQNQFTPELTVLRLDVRDLLLYLDFALKRAEGLRQPVSGPPDDTQEIQVQP